MSHQPYETWLLSDEKLNEEQEKTLQTHLDDCHQCQMLSNSWTQVESMMMTNASPEPAPGFQLRFQQRLALDRQRRQQRKMWFLTLGLAGLASLIFLGLTVISLFSTSFTYEISQAFASFARSLAHITHFVGLGQSIIKANPVLLLLVAVLGIGGGSASITLIVTWLSSLIRFYQPVKEGVVER